VYDFYGERGVFKFLNTPDRRDPVIVEMRRGSALLLGPPKNLWGLRRAIVGGGTVFGMILGYITLGLIRAADGSLPLIITGFVSFAALVALFFAAEERLFWPYIARRSPNPGIQIHIDRVEYHRFYHALVVTSEGQRFGLTIGGFRGKLRRAIALAG